MGCPSIPPYKTFGELFQYAVFSNEVFRISFIDTPECPTFVGEETLCEKVKCDAN
jgi:hypothetical protein